MNTPFEPKLISAIKEGLTPQIILKDIMAGIIVGIIAVPLSIAIAIASGVKPEQGLITAVIAGALISLFSGSRFQIGGPTGAFIVIVYGIVHQYGYEGLATATLMAGILLIFLGLTRLGDMIKFIPYPVTVGFTSGIAVIIFSSQIPDFFGLHLSQLPQHFIPKWELYLQSIHSINPIALAIGLLSIFIIVYFKRITDKIPGPLVAIIITTIITQYYQLPIETIASRFGNVPNHFPKPHLPILTIEAMTHLSSAALAIALLAGIESLLSAVVADGMTGRRHRSNMELIAQGIANIVSPIFGGIPATGAIARTAANIRNGGQTPLAGIIHALVVLLIFIFLAPLASMIPMATLAAILLIISFNMGEWHLFYKIFKSPKSDILVLLSTFGLTVLIDLTVAIEVGMVLAAFLFMKRMVDVTQINYISTSLNQELEDRKLPLPLSHGVEIFEINGPFFFGAAEKFKDTLKRVKTQPKVIILSLLHVPVIDATGLRTLEDVINQFNRSKIHIIIQGACPSVEKLLKEHGIINQIGPNNLSPTLEDAIKLANFIIQKPSH